MANNDGFFGEHIEHDVPQQLELPSKRSVSDHNEATRLIIIGTIASGVLGLTSIEASSLGDKIMSLIKKRGYVPRIKYCNILENGKCV